MRRIAAIVIVLCSLVLLPEVVYRVGLYKFGAPVLPPPAATVPPFLQEAMWVALGETGPITKRDMNVFDLWRLHFWDKAHVRIDRISGFAAALRLSDNTKPIRHRRHEHTGRCLVEATWIMRHLNIHELLNEVAGEVLIPPGRPLGLEQASHYYFDKPPERLEPQEAAGLANTMEYGFRVCPCNNPENSVRQRAITLRGLHERGAIDDAALARGLAAPLVPVFACATDAYVGAW